MEMRYDFFFKYYTFFKGFLSGIALKKYSFRQVGLVGAGLFVLGDILTIFVERTYQLAFTFGVIRGIYNEFFKKDKFKRRENFLNSLYFLLKIFYIIVFTVLVIINKVFYQANKISLLFYRCRFRGHDTSQLHSI